MVVYVDDAFILATVEGITSRWSHMMSDTVNENGTRELVEFAARLGLRPSWIQHEGTWGEHFDVTTSKRLLAIRRGAIPLHGIHEAAALTTARRTGFAFDVAAVRLHVPVYDQDGYREETLF